MRLLLSAFIIILYSLSAFADHFRISGNDYPDCSPIGAGGTKHSIFKIDNANSKLGRDNIKETFVIKNKKKEVKLKNKITVILMAEDDGEKIIIDGVCPIFLERDLLYKKELMQKEMSVTNNISFKNFNSKKPIVDYSYPVLASDITYDSVAKYKPGSYYSKLVPFSVVNSKYGNIIMRSLTFSLDHYENLDIVKAVDPSSEQFIYAYSTTKYKTKEKYIPKSSLDGEWITEASLIDLIEKKFSDFDNMIKSPRKLLFNDEEIEGFINKISELGKVYKIQTNH